VRRAAAIVLLSLAACSSGPKPEDAPRVVEDPARGVRYTCPAGWKSSDGEIRSKEGSLLTLRVYDLVEADKKFVARPRPPRSAKQRFLSAIRRQLLATPRKRTR